MKLYIFFGILWEEFNIDFLWLDIFGILCVEMLCALRQMLKCCRTPPASAISPPVPVKLGEVKHSKGFLEEETKIFLVENNRKVFGRRKNSN